MPHDVVVLGSANTDLVLGVERIPRPGETVMATHRADHAGGKGLNQAVACARAGAATTLVAALGRDEAGDRLAAVLAEEGVGTHLLRRVPERTGTAVVTVGSDGDNAIVVDAGANGALAGLTDADASAVAAASVLVAQLEVPVDVVVAAARAARAAGTLVVLNAAPARVLPPELLAAVDVLVVNEHEAEVVTGGLDAGTRADRDPEQLAAAALAAVPAVVVTLGGRGAVALARGASPVRVPARAVDVVDTTGAGDTAVGYLAAALAAGEDLAGALARAVLAGSLATTRAGAVPSIPTRAEVQEWAQG